MTIMPTRSFLQKFITTHQPRLYITSGAARTCLLVLRDLPQYNRMKVDVSSFAIPQAAAVLVGVGVVKHVKRASTGTEWETRRAPAARRTRRRPAQGPPRSRSASATPGTPARTAARARRAAACCGCAAWTRRARARRGGAGRSRHVKPLRFSQTII